MRKCVIILCFLFFCLGQSTQTINLHSGFNLISFNILPDDVSISNVLSGLGENATDIIGEGAASTNIGENWVGSISEISRTSGYWLKVIDDDILEVEGIVTEEELVYELHLIADGYRGRNIKKSLFK